MGDEREPDTDIDTDTGTRVSGVTGAGQGTLDPLRSAPPTSFTTTGSYGPIVPTLLPVPGVPASGAPVPYGGPTSPFLSPEVSAADAPGPQASRLAPTGAPWAPVSAASTGPRPTGPQSPSAPTPGPLPSPPDERVMPGGAPAPPVDAPPLRRRDLRTPRPESRGWSLGDQVAEEYADVSPSPRPGALSSPAPSSPARPSVGGPGQSARSAVHPPAATGFRLTPRVVPDARTTAGEKAAFALAIVLAPLGLLASIAAAAISSRRRGWVPGLVSAGIVVGSVLTVAAGAAGVVVDGIAADQARQRSTAAASQPMCRAIRLVGLDPSGGEFGWPTPGDSIASTLSAVQAYADRWAAVSALAPSTLQSGTASIVSAAVGIESSIASSRTIDDAGNRARLRAVRGQSNLPRWVATYCP